MPPKWSDCAAGSWGLALFWLQKSAFVRVCPIFLKSDSFSIKKRDQRAMVSCSAWPVVLLGSSMLIGVLIIRMRFGLSVLPH
jgi:hypothetical protein